ncbi:MAG TPA: PIN domain-containing protein, partial [Cytophagales bacterium]|nr:PIN domain-containing protein [Cytophagales bacterium]
MKYLTLDTCVWLELIKISLHSGDDLFDEICFWIENGHITHITTENLIREWDRNKVNKFQEISKHGKALQLQAIAPFRGTPELKSAYQPDAIEDIVMRRMDRVDEILKICSETALENAEILNDAVQRNLHCLAPNHSEDSFRDTVNILTLLNHIKTRRYQNCCFSTLNYSDFSEAKSKKHALHPALIDIFKEAELEYVYCDEEPFGNKLFGVKL